MIPQFRKYDSDKQKILLDDKYLFSYTYSDGFTERLLAVEFVIDFGYRCKIQVKAFNQQSFYKEFEVIPEPIFSYMEQLLNADYNSLKPYYDYITIGIDDMGGSQLLINIDAETIETGVLNGLPEVYFVTPIEKLLFVFNKYMKDFFEGIYKNEMLK